MRAKRNALIDISGLKIERGIPLIEPVKRVNQWNGLFDGMEAGDSVLVPNKVNETHTRIWRTS